MHPNTHTHRPCRPTAFQTLKTIASQNRRRLIGTFSLVAAENLLINTYPLFAGFAINQVVSGSLWGAAGYALLMIVIYSVSAARRSVDTRAFAKIYAETAVPVILRQRESGSGHSETAARVALSREFVDFFELHLPLFTTSIFSAAGSVVMLLAIEFWVGAAALLVAAVFALLVPRFAAVNDRLYHRLNNRLEKEVDLVGTANERALSKHYSFSARLRILISNREAASFLAIGLAMSFLFGTALLLLTLQGYGSAGHVYSVTTYLWNFAMSLDDSPQLLEQYAKLKDIGKRVEV
ncbi:ABC transporter six-transmembrane domain-containing protein [Eikenella sp. Marseille-P7795]|uniref:ABC transporter six-transmembrane domain-containing protein n=1 Tax=Eikenella sp. Marseille-P7795 TaxID=2866577 RepID=UPI001CE4B440|nr:ABC transporter six-transmembrane domain-containing protein [Eikenella sp. Marseille-P7795]